MSDSDFPGLPPAPKAATGENTHDEDDESSLRHYLIAWNSLEPRLRVLTGLVIAEIFTGALILVLNNYFPSGFQGTFAVESIHGSIPRSSQWIAFGALLLGFVLLLAGLRHSARVGRLMLLGVLAVLLALETFTLNVYRYALLQSGAIAFYFAAGSLGADRARATSRFIGWGIALACLVFFGGMFVSDAQKLGLLLFQVFVPLALLFLLAGTDWAEMIDALITWAVKTSGLGEKDWLLVGATAALATSVVLFRETLNSWESAPFYIYTVQHFSEVIGGHLITISTLLRATTAAMAIFFVLRLARFENAWPIHLSWASLALAVIGWSVVIAVVSHQLQFWRIAPYPNPYDDAVLLVVQLVLASVVALGLVICGRKPQWRWLAPVFLFVVLLMVCNSLLPTTEDLGFSVAAGTLLVLSWLMKERRRLSDVRTPILLLVVLNLSLMTLFALGEVVYPALRRAADDQVLIAACVLFVALVWDIISSGHGVTNGDGGLFPRRARVLLFLGYVTLAVGLVVYFGSLKAAGIDAGGNNVAGLMHVFADTDRFVQQGILSLGPATLLTLFVLRFGKWHAQVRRIVVPTRIDMPEASTIGEAQTQISRASG